MNWVLLFLSYICASLMVGGQWMWKIGVSGESQAVANTGVKWWMDLLRSPWIWSGLFFYILATLFWIYLLKEYRLGIVYPLIIALALLNSTVVAKFFLAEPFTVYNSLGLFLLLGAVVLLTGGS
ncbi:MAG: hypothetical protein P1S59_10790 [bacterium]|nr:hypothetical protein [bacterium]